MRCLKLAQRKTQYRHPNLRDDWFYLSTSIANQRNCADKQYKKPKRCGPGPTFQHAEHEGDVLQLSGEDKRTKVNPKLYCHFHIRSFLWQHPSENIHIIKRLVVQEVEALSLW
jgi:hypothetical protein